MQNSMILVVAGLALAFANGLNAQDYVAEVRTMVERTTLDQPGTQPFHLKAEFAPSLAGDNGSGRTGTIEIWWESPTRWRREIHSSEFSQTEIVDGTHDWQKNSATYFPEWLRELAVALVRPVPNLDEILAHVKTAEVRNILGATHISWGEQGSDGTVSKGLGQGIDLNNGGPISLTVLGASVYLKDSAADFHGRRVARVLSSGGSGGPGAVAHVTVLEDLKDTAVDFFDASAPGSDPLLQTAVVKEIVERQNVIEDPKTAWPALPIGPIEGAMLFEVVIDNTGQVRELGTYLSDNPGLREVAEARVRAMRFQPYLVNGLPAQVVTTITLPFKTTRPPGVETFPASKDIFDKARKLCFPAAGGTSPYILKSEFTTRNRAGEVAQGTYTDTWLSDTQWRREAVFGKSRLIRTRNGEKGYQQAEGPDSGLLLLLFEVMEPIPDTTSWYEIEWLVKHDSVDGFAALRISRGHVSPEGVLDPRAQGYWFDESGRLIKTHERGIETRLLLPSDFHGMQVARRIEILNQGKLALRLDVTELGAPETVDPSTFVLKGHEWVHQFTPEVR